MTERREPTTYLISCPTHGVWDTTDDIDNVKKHCMYCNSGLIFTVITKSPLITAIDKIKNMDAYVPEKGNLVSHGKFGYWLCRERVLSILLDSEENDDRTE